MSSVGMPIYELSKRIDNRPEWVRLERIDYCDQDGVHMRGDGLRSLIRFFKKIF